MNVKEVVAIDCIVVARMIASCLTSQCGKDEKRESVCDCATVTVTYEETVGRHSSSKDEKTDGGRSWILPSMQNEYPLAKAVSFEAITRWRCGEHNSDGLYT